MHIFAALTFPSSVLRNHEPSKLEGCWFAHWRCVRARSWVAECLSNLFCAPLSHFLTLYHLVTVVDSCCITRSHCVSSLFLHLLLAQYPSFKKQCKVRESDRAAVAACCF